MARIEKSIEIKAPPEKVWEMLAWDRATEWIGDMMTSMEYTSEVRTVEDKFKVGVSAHALTHSKMEYDLEITESTENEKMTTRSTSGNMTAIGTFTLKPTEAGTEMTYVVDYEMSWGILGKIIGKLGRRSGEKDTERYLEKLKSILEK